MDSILAIILVVALVVVGGAVAWFTVGQPIAAEYLETQRIETEIQAAQVRADELQAEANAAEKRADESRAAGEQARAEAEGAAILAPAEAAAGAVRVQTFLVGLWGILTPIFLLLGVAGLVVGAIAVGIVLAAGQRRLGLVALMRERVRAKDAAYRDVT